MRIRLTADERSALDAAAERARLGPCSFARVAVVSALDLTPTQPPRRRREPSEAARNLAQFIAHLGWIGNNLNECARAANSGLGIDFKAIEAATDELRRLREAIIADRDDQDGRPCF